MPVCCFNGNYDNKYSCTYEISPESIKVNVDYDIGQEIETKDGVRRFSVETTFEPRDILIVDSALKNYYLLKDAQYNGMSNRYGTLDSQDITSFITSVYFKSDSANKLTELLPNPKVKKIRLYSKAIAEYIKHPSVHTSNSKEKYDIALSRKRNAKSLEIKKNNIKQISLADDWKCTKNYTSINVQMCGYIEVEVFRRVDYSKVFEYMYELMIFMQLFCPSKFEIDRIMVQVDNTYYDFFTLLNKPKYVDKHIPYSTSIDLLEFIKLCYLRIPYRNSKGEIRNIPYVILNTYRNIEDNFLMFYRFIECFYKRQNINKFIESSIQYHYNNKNKHTIENTENEAQEIVCLRNHYVHSGYYIKNNSLRISFDKEKRDSRDYTVKVDFSWIYEKTKELYLIVIDIIFTDMLGIKEYEFKRPF